MDYPLFENDLSEVGIIDPLAMHADAQVAPVAVLCFFNELLTEMAREGQLRQIYTLRSEIGANPIYQMTLPQGVVSVVHPGVGAPLAAAVTEELRGLGVRTLVACGGAGALRDELTLGKVMVVSSALRDEGTSFHYAPPSRIIDADPRGVTVLTEFLSQRRVDHLVGRTWTTDGFFRETRGRVQRRVEEECVMVDMEASAFIAVAKYHDLNFGQLLYAGDTLAGETWDSRHWDSALSHRRALFQLAAQAALRLHDHCSRPLNDG